MQHVWRPGSLGSIFNIFSLHHHLDSGVELATGGDDDDEVI